MTGTHRDIIPDCHAINQEYITFCCRLNYNTLDVVDLSDDATSSTTCAFVLSALVQCFDVTTNDAITADDTSAFGASATVPSPLTRKKEIEI